MEIVSLAGLGLGMGLVDSVIPAILGTLSDLRFNGSGVVHGWVVVISEGGSRQLSEGLPNYRSATIYGSWYCFTRYILKKNYPFQSSFDQCLR